LAAEKIAYTAEQSKLNISDFSIVTGDITKENLNLDPDINEKLTASVTHVFHLAAVYDLGVEKDLAFHVNLNGTIQINDWVAALKNLERYIYFSTAYGAGTREGRIYEHELIKGQAFKNHYEHSKYEAEILVENLKKEIPTTIIRPDVVREHSVTGETSKFDGIYFMLNLLDRLYYLPIIPYFTDTPSTKADGVLRYYYTS